MNSIPEKPVGQTYSADIVAPPEVVRWRIEGVTVNATPEAGW